MWIRTATLACCAIFLAQPAQGPAATGRKALDFLLSGNLPEFGKLLAPAAKEKLSPEFLRDHVRPEVAGFGKLEQIGQPLVAPSGSNSLVSFPVRFSLVKINIQFTLDASGHVAGLYFRPADSLLPPDWQRPAYSNPKLFTEREVTVGDDEWSLPGTLSVPLGKGPFSAVVLVHGPGPDDRDETIYSNHMFKDLAEGLASRNIAVLRYDKRTKVYGTRMSGMSFTLQQETVEDAVRAAAFLRRQPKINPKRIFVIAHSLGGYALPRIAKQDGKLAGAVILAGNARPIEDVVLDQATFTTESKINLRAEERSRFENLKREVAKVKKLEPGNPNNPPVVLGLPADYLLDLRTYNPVAEARNLSIPLLVLQGDRDFQVTDKDFQLWKSGLASRKGTEFHSYPGLNHLFIPGEGKPSPAEYRIPGNVSAQVITDTAKWIAAQP